MPTWRSGARVSGKGLYTFFTWAPPSLILGLPDCVKHRFLLASTVERVNILIATVSRSFYDPSILFLLNQGCNLLLFFFGTHTGYEVNVAGCEAKRKRCIPGQSHCHPRRVARRSKFGQKLLSPPRSPRC
uniref:Uncharacterized protein n=1 Tax=Ixodes ricinus TaxID=34613 RepID=A0A6B0UR06_IXORI